MPLAGSSSLAFPGSGVGRPECVIPPGGASEKRIDAVCPCGEQISGVPRKWGEFAGVRCAAR